MAPEKIYIRPLLTEDGNYIRRRVRLQKEDNSIEYVHKDAFIEKAIFYIQQYWIWNAKMIEDFKKYMEE